MSLIIEDGSNVTGAESYISVAWCDDYWSKRELSSMFNYWDSLDNLSKKEAALRIARQFLDAHYKWKGARQYTTQVLSFPRSGLFYPGTTAELTNVVPQEIKEATAELAARAASGTLTSAAVSSDSSENIGPISNLKAGDLQVTYSERSQKDYISSKMGYDFLDGLVYPFIDVSLTSQQTSQSTPSGGISFLKTIRA